MNGWGWRSGCHRTSGWGWRNHCPCCARERWCCARELSYGCPRRERESWIRCARRCRWGCCPRCRLFFVRRPHLESDGCCSHASRWLSGCCWEPCGRSGCGWCSVCRCCRVSHRCRSHRCRVRHCRVDVHYPHRRCHVSVRYRIRRCRVHRCRHGCGRNCRRHGLCRSHHGRNGRAFRDDGHRHDAQRSVRDTSCVRRSCASCVRRGRLSRSGDVRSRSSRGRGSGHRCRSASSQPPSRADGRSRWQPGRPGIASRRGYSSGRGCAESSRPHRGRPGYSRSSGSRGSPRRRPHTAPR